MASAIAAWTFARLNTVSPELAKAVRKVDPAVVPTTELTVDLLVKAQALLRPSSLEIPFAQKLLRRLTEAEHGAAAGQPAAAPNHALHASIQSALVGLAVAAEPPKPKRKPSWRTGKVAMQEVALPPKTKWAHLLSNGAVFVARKNPSNDVEGVLLDEKGADALVCSDPRLDAGTSFVLPNGGLAVAGTQSSLRVWDAQLKWQVDADLQFANGARPTHVNALADGTLLAYNAAEDKTLVLNPATRARVLQKGRCLSDTTGFFADHFALADKNTHVVTLYAEDGTSVATLQGHTQSVTSAIGLRDGRVLTTSTDGTAKIWSQEGECLATLSGGKPGYVLKAIELANGTIVTDAATLELRVWAADGSTQLAKIAQPLKVDPHDGATLLPVGDDQFVYACEGGLRVYDASGEVACTLDKTEAKRDVAVLPDGRIRMKIWRGNVITKTAVVTFAIAA